MPYDDAPLIVGLSSRVPGARNNDRMWNILAEGRCTVSLIDPRLFDHTLHYDPRKVRRGKSYSNAAGQLEQLYHFDAGFFGITPREADQMDPQQALMLQSVWEAVEDAGLNIEALAGERTGVFVGSSLVENLTLNYFDFSRSDSTFILDNTLCIIANRVSAAFDFRGPSFVLDTACSSSLYALHLAAEALRRGELDTAIVGGVHSIRTPGGYVGFSQARMMSATGLCRAFDADADGYVRSEASVALVLQRPEVALRMGARRRARLLATGVNSDGATSQLTVPSQAQQTRLVERVLDGSTIDPDDIAFFEAHGTGTQVGDPIEAASLGAAVAALRRTPLLIGSSKTNFGHSEPASGLVALAKTLLAFEHRALPASLHFDNPNPNIAFEALNLKVNTALRPLGEEGPLFAGVNAFGFGGTNVSVMVGSETGPARLPARKIAQPGPQRPHWLLLSAASGLSLKALANAWADLIDRSHPADHADLAAAAGARPFLRERIAVPLDETAPAVLRGLAQEETPDRAIADRVRLHKGRTVFAFPGNGTQTVGMGRREYRENARFRHHFDQIADAFGKTADIDLRSCLDDDDLGAKLMQPLVAQPLLFAYQIALARSLCEAGFRPEAVVGHSVGEIAALHFAGCFDLDAAVHIITSRSRAFESLRGTGTMAAVAATPADVERALGGLPNSDLVIAAINSPRSVTVSGSAESLALLRRVTVAGKRLPMVQLRVEVPYHSPAVDGLRDRFLSDLAGLSFRRPDLPVASPVFGRMLHPWECDAQYLWRNARDAVRFSDALTALVEIGPTCLVEMAPIASLVGNVRDLTRQEGHAIDHFFPLKSGSEVFESFEPVAVRGWAQGLHIDAAALAGTLSGPPPRLPAYPWDEREHFAPLTSDGLDAWAEHGPRRLVGLRAQRAAPEWVRDITPTAPEWIADHRLGDTPVVPATALVEMALDAADELWPGAAVELRDFDIVAPAVVPDDGIRLRTQVDEATRAVLISQRPRLTEAEWTPIARGTLRQSAAATRPSRLHPPQRAEQGVSDLYDFLSGKGLNYGTAFRRLAGYRLFGPRVVWASLREAGQDEGFILDPMAFDAALHGLAQLIRGSGGGERTPDDGSALIPVRIGQLRLRSRGKGIAFARLQVMRWRRHSLELHMTLLDAEHDIVADVTGIEFARVDLTASRRMPRLRTSWRQVRLRAPSAAVRLPAGWARPQQTLARLGFTAQKPMATSLSLKLAAVRQALMAGGDRSHGPLSDVLAAAPDLADDLRALMLSAEGRDPRQMASRGYASRRIWRQAERLAAAISRGWKREQRLNLLISGVPDTEVLRRLLSDPQVDQLSLTLGGEDRAGLLFQLLPPEFHALIVSQPAAGSADLLLDTDIVPSGMAPLAAGGLRLRLDMPDFLPEAADPISSDTVAFRVEDGLTLRLQAKRVPSGHIQAKGRPLGVRLAAPYEGSLPPVAAGLATAPDMVGTEATHCLILCNLRAGEDMVQALLRALGQVRQVGPDATQPLVFVLFCPPDDRQAQPLIEALSSLVRSLTNERPENPCALISVRGEVLPDEVSWPELIEMALHNGVIQVNGDGVLRGPLLRVLPPAAPKGHSLGLEQAVPGRLDSLAWVGRRRGKPGPDEIEIAVAATGLNFRDVMSARGLLPERVLDIGATAAALGMECAGVVVRAGERVTAFAPGDRVMAFAPAAFATHVVLPQEAVTRIPEPLDTVSAAAVPVTFLTAWHALVDVARIKEGDVVLVHGAAGGVGLAAIQVARLQGARVLATAGTSEKRAIARAFGADEVFGSRDLSFAEEVRRATAGRGVDIVLNSLAGEPMQRSLECLAPFGRFVELGKRDYLEGTRLDLRPFLRNLSYHGLDLDQYVAHAAAGAGQTMRDIAAAFADGRLRGLPITVFGAADVEEGFQHMLASHHTGKIVVTPPPVQHPKPPRAIGDDWVILGGTGGLGLATARMLLDKGAAHVHLVSLSGEIGLENKRAEAWVSGDPRLSLHALDAADPDRLTALFDRIEGEGRRINGIVHSAMVLRDRRLADLDLFEAERVIHAKLGVALALDRVLRARRVQPETVIFFSSIAAQLGNIGQAAYSAANAAVEAIAAGRRRDGLAGLAIGWGPVGDAGYLTRETKVAAQLSRLRGIELLPVREVLDELLEAIRFPPPQNYCYAAIEPDDLARQLPALTGYAFSAVVSEGVTFQPDGGALVETLRNQSWETALGLIQQEIRDMLATIMRLPPEQFDLDRPLSTHGLDSLMAMELRLEVEKRFGTQLPTGALSRDITGSRLAVLLLTGIRNETTDEQTL